MSLSQNYTNRSISYEAGVKFNNSSYSTQFYTYNTYAIDNVEDYNLQQITFKSGKTKNNMAQNDVVIASSCYQLFNCLDRDEFTQKVLSEDLVLKLYKDFPYSDEDRQPLYNLNIVGVSESGNTYIKGELHNKLFGGYDYAITRLTTEKSSNKDFIDYINTYNENNIGLKIQFKSTPIFDNFGETIEELSAPLLYVGLALAVFAGFMLMNFISTSSSYKKREIGVLRAIGARGKDVFSIFFSESFVICLC